jgi:2-C-methyl-D-erythritol 2,4-cyclodiphosphate synthase
MATASPQHATSLRIGLGHDTHRLGEGGPLVLGGIRIDFPQHLIGHSDADVLLHAITDALLGAANMGDIGEWFPDTAPENRDRDSQSMLKLVVERVAEADYQIINLDCIVFAEAPKLTPHKLPIRQSIARILNIPLDAISVKAKTGEGVDAVGERIAISAQCVALLCKPRV